MRKKLLALALATTLMATAVTGAGAQVEFIEAPNGAAGLVAAVVDAAIILQNNGEIDLAVVELNNSLNNLRALNNVLNNSPIPSDNTVEAAGPALDQRGGRGIAVVRTARGRGARRGRGAVPRSIASPATRGIAGAG